MHTIILENVTPHREAARIIKNNNATFAAGLMMIISVDDEIISIDNDDKYFQFDISLGDLLELF